MSKPYAIFQFGPNSTRYEITPPVCPHCQKAAAWLPSSSGLDFPRCTEKSNIEENQIVDNPFSTLRVTGLSTSNIVIEVYHD